MLTENEKMHTICLWKIGRSYQEIAQEISDWRNHFALIELNKDVVAYIKERDI